MRGRRWAAWFVCTSVACAGTPAGDAATVVDAGRDAGRDAAVIDAAAADAAVPDAALPLDASVRDAAIPDASRPDAWVPEDAGVRDAALPDAFVPDAAPPSDAAMPRDASVPDARVDLGWPFDASIPSECADNPADTSGTAWSGWANYQYPATSTVSSGSTSPSLFGQVWRSGETDSTGQASGWSAEVLVGPYGTLPTGDGRCWSARAASYNVDVGNNDEYRASATAGAPGLYGLYFRYRPAGGQWRYGDRNGSDDGLQEEQAGLLVVPDAVRGAPVVVVSMNLRCRLDDWPARKPLLVAALARVNPDLMGFQEDCLDVATGRSQAEELRAEVSGLVGRGYELRRVTTHVATSGTDSFEEGISLLSAHHIEQSRVLDLPYEVFARKAIAVDVTIGGGPVRFYTTHLEFGSSNAGMRTQEAQAVVADFPSSGRIIVTGDMNATPESEAVMTFSARLVDSWQRANPSQQGLTFPADLPARRIDYVFVEGMGVVGARILDEHEGSVYLSDHRGVAVALE